MDESGCTGVLPTSTSNIQPIIVIAGIILEESQLHSLTIDYLNLKRRFFPGKLPVTSEFLQWVLVEIKGNEIRKYARSSIHRERSHTYSFLDEFLKLLEKYAIKIIGRLWVKGIAQPFDGKAVYTSSVQHICKYFNHYITTVNSTGFIIADSRDPALNVNVAHSIFTMKFKSSGDAIPQIIEMPSFGHSQNHVGIQIADLLCSALLFPMATCTYCLGYVHNIHVHAEHIGLKRSFGARLRSLQYMYFDEVKWQGGVTVSDIIGKKSAAAMFC
ncbi:MAG TPA: DUF3800 domain-containing protein [Thermoguttaceae bacterium]